MYVERINFKFVETENMFRFWLPAGAFINSDVSAASKYAYSVTGTYITLSLSEHIYIGLCPGLSQ
jgi:hypothetical protein